MEKHKEVRCKRCGCKIDSENYAEHLVEFHCDFSEMRKNGKLNLLQKRES